MQTPTPVSASNTALLLEAFQEEAKHESFRSGLPMFGNMFGNMFGDTFGVTTP
jgi:hypothetical protein